MLAAVKGYYDGEQIVIDEDVKMAKGQEVIITILDMQKKRKDNIDWDSFVVPSERGNNVDEYMREMRENDRM